MMQFCRNGSFTTAGIASFSRTASLLLGLVVACGSGSSALSAEPVAASPSDQVSYHKQIRPIFQANCQGCHQPAKSYGNFQMVTFAGLMGTGESGLPAIVPGNPEASYLIQEITPVDGRSEMPKGKPSLSETDIELVRSWIAQGAQDDTPAAAADPIDPAHPPVYTLPPLITSLDFSPDGSLLAVAGFHEVILWKGDGSEAVARLVGVSDRIETVRFSPDGTRLAVAGGRPGKVGEIQVWNLADRSLALSVPTTFDTVYGASWSPDGQLIAYGCGDNSVRAINATTGEQVLFQGAHNDWVRDTVFSVDGSHLVSVGRDMTTKLTEMATQRFVDNVTSITPGALKGGLMALTRHPMRDELVVGGADGVCKVYRIFRQTSRVIGDDANLIRKMPAMMGRIFGVDVSPDGKRMAAVSSLDGQGQVHVYGYEFDTALPDNIRAIVSKVGYSGEEQAALDKYYADGVTLLADIKIPQASLYAVAFHPVSGLVAVGGSDGQVRWIDPVAGQITSQFVPVPVVASTMSMADRNASIVLPKETVEPSTLPIPAGSQVASLEVEPATIALSGPFSYAQLVVTGILDNGDRVDVTRHVQIAAPTGLVDVSPAGLVRPLAEGSGSVGLSLAGGTAGLVKEISVTVTGMLESAAVDYVRDVNPVLSKLGCNQGTCHGSAQGKNGFKLSLRGYDPIFDLRSLTDDLASRRVTVASPNDSLMLVKPTGEVPHVGGVVLTPGEPNYEILSRWIADGARVNLQTARVAKIDLYPTNPVVQQVGAQQQMRVLATYTDGVVRDVTREAFVETGNMEVATASRTGLMTTLRRGEAAMLARYEGAYAATILTVMGDRTGFTWQEPPANNRIDELVAGKWKRMKIQPSGLCSDEDFLRRLFLDLTGLPPTAEEVRAFLADPRETTIKRNEAIDRLIGSESYVDHWTNKWADLLQVNRKFLAPQGAMAFRQWIRQEIMANTPYDEFARKIITATGSNKDNPAASYYKILRNPTDTMENTTHLFLAIRFNCNKCHDHPFERWTQDQYYETSAFFAQVGLDRDPASGDQNIGGTDVEGAKPLYEVVVDRAGGEVIHDRTKQVAPPKFPFTASVNVPDTAPRREQLSAWLTARDNPHFARSYVNRMWGYLFGVGIMEPIDDIRAGNPPTNPELLEYLTQEFLASNFNVRHIQRLICQSRAYQLSIEPNSFNEDDKTNYSHAMARRLPAEVLYDAVHLVTGSVSKIPGVAPGTRAAALPDSGLDLSSGFLTTFGRPVRESACECERTGGLQLGPVLALVSGPTISDAIEDGGNAIAQMIASQPDDRQAVREIFLRVLGRNALEEEVDNALAVMGSIDVDHERLIALRDQREAYFAPIRTQMAADREAAIAAAQAALAAYEVDYVPRRAEQERLQQVKIGELEMALKQFEETALLERLAAWEKLQQAGPAWTPLVAKELKATSGAELKQLDDGSIVATGPLARTTYTLVAQTDLQGITGIRLEALTDPTLPALGPGRAPSNGNFVVNELQLEAAPLATPDQKVPVKLVKPLVDFAQDTFTADKLVDGDLGDGNGWAVSPKTGLTHWATMETEADLGHAGGTHLVVNLVQNYGDNNHSLGRFRISVTTAARPIGLGIPGSLGALLAVAPELRTPEQQAELIKTYKEVDEEYLKRVAELAATRQPLPADPMLIGLQDQVSVASRPIPSDARLDILNQNILVSEQQRTNRRLTGAQDLTWALINTPEFLFNH